MDSSMLDNNDDIDNDYIIVIKRMDDILQEVTTSIDERVIYESIISNLEQSAADNINNDKIVQLPSIGCIRKNPIRKVIKANYANFKEARKTLNKDEYKDHVRGIIVDARIQQAKEDYDKSILKKIRSRNKKKYDKFYINLGKAYAELYIQSFLFFREVPFNQDVQDAYDSINNKL